MRIPLALIVALGILLVFGHVPAGIYLLLACLVRVIKYQQFPKGK